jgi:hypothetical protein
MTDYGPAGGNGGSAFDDENLSQGLQIRTVYVWYGDYIDAIQVQYEDPATRMLKLSDRHGGYGATKLAIIMLQPDEFITGISGRTGKFVDSLTLATTLVRYPRYGGSGGDNYYNYPDQPEEVFAFSGRSGSYLDAVGIHTRPLQAPQHDTVDANWNSQGARHLKTWNSIGLPEEGDFYMPIRFVGEGGPVATVRVHLLS